MIYRGTTGRFPEKSDARWIAAEGGDVIADPFNSHALVEQTKVSVAVGIARESKEGDVIAGLR